MTEAKKEKKEKRGEEEGKEGQSNAVLTISVLIGAYNRPSLVISISSASFFFPLSFSLRYRAKTEVGECDGGGGRRRNGETGARGRGAVRGRGAEGG